MMRRTTVYSFAALLTLILSTSCGKECVRKDAFLDEYIGFTMSDEDFSEGTRGLMGGGAIHSSGNKIKIYDLLSGFDGEINGRAWTDDSAYIDDWIVFAGDAVEEAWRNVSGYHYPWPNSGSHRFFGWLSEDAATESAVVRASDLFGAEPVLNPDNELTISTLTLTNDSPQFDFIYSDVVHRLAGTSGYTAKVPLKFRHLFSAFSMSVENAMENPVTIRSVELEGLRNRNSGTISFNDATVVSLGAPTVGTGFFATDRTPVTLAAKTSSSSEKLDVITWQKNPSSWTTRLMWPQTSSQISPSNPKNGDFYESSDSIIVVNYSLDARNYTTRLKFPAASWTAGQKSHFNLVFTDKIIVLTAQDIPWEYYEMNYDYKEFTVSGESVRFDDRISTVDNVGKTVTIINGAAAQGSFSIMTPDRGHWNISMKGDTGYFTVSPSSGVIDARQNNGRIDFRIIPVTTGMPRGRDMKINLVFTVSGGPDKDMEINADSELNTDGYTIILPR